METKRLIIRELDLSLAGSTQRLSVEESNRRFIPDEVFETEEDARDCIELLMDSYQRESGPFVYAVELKSTREHIGHVEASPIGPGEWELGYHIGEAHQNCGYATEAVKAFVPFVLGKLNITKLYGICRADNLGSRRVLEKCGFTLIGEVVGKYLGQHAPVRRYVYRV